MFLWNQKPPILRNLDPLDMAGTQASSMTACVLVFGSAADVQCFSANGKVIDHDGDTYPGASNSPKYMVLENFTPLIGIACVLGALTTSGKGIVAAYCYRELPDFSYGPHARCP